MAKRVLVGNCFSRPAGGPIFFCRSHLPSLTLHAHISSPSHFVRAQVFCLYESTRYGLEDLSCVAMPLPRKRLDEIESWSSASTVSAPKRIRGSACKAGFEAYLVMNSHCFTWQNASLKELDEDNKRYLWRMPTLVKSESVRTPSWCRSRCGEQRRSRNTT